MEQSVLGLYCLYMFFLSQLFGSGTQQVKASWKKNPHYYGLPCNKGHQHLTQSDSESASIPSLSVSLVPRLSPSSAMTYLVTRDTNI